MVFQQVVILSWFNLLSTLTSVVYISTSQDALQESLSSIVSSELREFQSDQDINQIEFDLNKVVKKMCTVRDSIPSAALTEMKSKWLILSSKTQSNIADQFRKAFSNAIASFLSSINKIISKEKDPNLLTFMEDLSSTIPDVLTAASDSSDSLVPISSSLAIDEVVLSDSSVQDDAIKNYTQTSTKKLFKREECNGFWGLACILKPSILVPYNQTVYSPNVTAFERAFDSVIKSWMSLYNEQVEKYLKDISLSTGDSFRSKLFRILEESHQRVITKMEVSQRALAIAEQNISFLQQGREEFKNIEMALKDSMKK